MADIRRIVDELRFYLESTEAEMTDSVREAARQYAETCKLVNERLRRCGDFLNQNLRSEAIQLAEAEPDLLELIATLDFPGRSNWDEVVSLYNLPVAEPILMDFAEALNEAYALQEPIKKILDKHRFLALARAPFKQRLAVLWELVSQDGTLGTWESDACEMERARLAEIDLESREAAKRLDSRTLQSLLDEIASGHWIEAVAPQVKKTIMNRWKETTSTVARSELEELAGALEAAFQDRDFAQAQSLKAQWDRVEPIARLDRFDPLTSRVGTVFRWIQEEESEQETRRKGDQARAELSAALDDRWTPRDELQRLSRRALKIGPALPEPLAERVRTRLAEIDQEERKRRNLIVSCCATAFVLVVLGAALLVRQSMHAAESQKAAQTVIELAANGQLVEARNFANDHRDMFPSLEWSRVLHELTQAEENEAKRLAKLKELMDTDIKMAPYEEARAKLDEAGRIAKTDAEKARISQLEAELEKRHQDELAGKKADLQEQIDSVHSAQARAEAMIALPVPPAGLQPLLSQMAQKIAGLQHSVGDLNSPLGQQIEPLRSRLSELQQAAEHAEQTVRLAEAIRNQSSILPTASDCASRVKQYVGLVTRFANKFPNDARAADFKKVGDERAIYLGVCEWQTLADGWTKLLPGDLDDAKKRRGQCDEFVKNHRECPACSPIERYSRFLSAIVRRYEGEGGSKSDGLISKLRELYGGPLMQDVHTVWDWEGNAYYIKSESDFRGKPVANIQYFSDFQGKTANKTILVRELKSGHSEPAVQNRLAASAIHALDGLTIAKWEPSLNQLCHEILKTHDLDAFLQYALLRYTMEYASGGSQSLEPELQKPLEMLADPRLDLSVCWMLPNDAAAKAARVRARQLVTQVIGWESAWERAEESRRHFGQELFTRCVFVGALKRDKEGDWSCSSCWKPDGNYDLVVAVPADGQSPPSWQVIGKVNNRRLELTQRAETTALCEGRLVLARSAAAADAVAGTGGSEQSERAQ